MRKRGKKLVAMALAMSMAVSTVGIQAFAEEPITNVIENTDGTTTQQTITTTTTTNQETGNVMVEIKIEAATDGTDTDGNIVDRDEVSIEKTETDENGKVVESTFSSTMNEIIESEDGTVTKTEKAVESGYENTSADTIEPGQIKDEWKDKTSVTVGVAQDNPETEENESVVKESIHETFTDGDKKKDENDPEYNYTETTIDREVEGAITKGETTEAQLSDTGLKAVGPEDYEGKINIIPYGSSNGMVPVNLSCYDQYEVKDENGNVIEVRYYPNTNRKQNEYDLLPDEIKALYKQDTDGIWKPINKETGEFAASQGYSAEKHGVWWDYVYDGNTEESISGQAIANNSWGNIDNFFVLYDKAGNRAYAYCMDAKIGTDFTVRYTVENLDEADYFKGTPEEQEEARAHVRAIALNGYWGTDIGTGSLKKLKDDLTAALDDGFEFVFSYTEGGVTYAYDSTTQEGKQRVIDLLINNINDGDALCATQGSLWNFGRNNNNWMGFNPYRGNSPNGMEGGGAELRMELIKAYLTSEYLKDKVAEDEKAKESTIVDMDSFLKDNGLELTVGDKVADTEANQNDNDDDDVYNVDITFAMVVEPSTENGDDLVVKLIGADGSVIRQARLAGDASNDEGFSSIKKNANGSYTFEDLHLAENSNITFDLKVEGIQYLEQGVYIYKATAGYDNNQTLIGIAEGEKEICVSQKFTVNFNVEESITTEHYWRDEDVMVKIVTPQLSDPESNNPDVSGDPTLNNPNPVVPLIAADTIEITESEVPLSAMPAFGEIEIENDLIPLGVLPETGDNSLWFMFISLLSGLSLAGASLVDKMKRRKH